MARALREDSLSLSPVPPPAPDGHRFRDAIVALLFVLALALPLAGAIVNRDLAITEFENRRAAQWPAMPRGLGATRAWPAAFEAAFADRFGGRDALIALHHFTKAVLFDVSPLPKLMIGSDGWLYYLGEDGKSLDRDYRGVYAYAAQQPFIVAAEYKRRHDYLVTRGIPYVVLIVPDKHTIYPEYLPFWVSRGPGATRLDLLYAALKAYPDVKVLDIRPDMLEAKARDRIYFKTDSHWNLLGAQIGYNALVAALKPLVPSIPGVPLSRPPYDPDTDVYSGDLSRLMGLPNWFDEEDVAPFTKLLGNAKNRCAKRSDAPLPADYPEPADKVQIFTCDRPDLPTAVVYRDSMGDLLIPMLSENFRRVVYVADRHLDRALIEREKPDVVIEEVVERSMHVPAAVPM